MTNHRISTTVTSSVILGTGNYVTTLRITAQGEILPNDNSAALVVPAGLASVQVHNAGKIYGGYGSQSGAGIPGGVGGAGIDLHSTSFVSNSGIISGGYGGYGYLNASGAGGVGVHLGAASTLINHATIYGGPGGYAYYANAAAGGVGVDVSAQGHLSNFGTISGGSGGQETGSFYYGGAGGAGVHLHAGAVLSNSGTISGGRGGEGGLYHGPGGAGVIVDGATLVNAGTIFGGASDNAGGDAVKFGRMAGTLVVDPGAVFNGLVDARGGGADTLVLAGKAPGQLSGFGTTILGFATITEDAHAQWALAGTIGGNAIRIGGGATLTLDNAVSTTTIAFAHGVETLVLGEPTLLTSVLHGFSAGDTIDLQGLQATSFTYGGGTLTLYDADNTAIDTLSFAGHYTAADFSLMPDGNRGTDVIGVHAAPGGFERLPTSPFSLVQVLTLHHPTP